MVGKSLFLDVVDAANGHIKTIQSAQNRARAHVPAPSSAGTGVVLFGGPFGGPPIFGGGGTPPVFPLGAKSSAALFASPSLK